MGASRGRRRRRGEWGNESKILIERGDIDSAQPKRTNIAYAHTQALLFPLPKCICSKIPEGDAAASGFGTKFIFVNSTIVCRGFFLFNSSPPLPPTRKLEFGAKKSVSLPWMVKRKTFFRSRRIVFPILAGELSPLFCSSVKIPARPLLH